MSSPLSPTAALQTGRAASITARCASCRLTSCCVSATQAARSYGRTDHDSLAEGFLFLRAVRHARGLRPGLARLRIRSPVS
jgi:hypothetical protein